MEADVVDATGADSDIASTIVKRGAALRSLPCGPTLCTQWKPTSSPARSIEELRILSLSHSNPLDLVRNLHAPGCMQMLQWDCCAAFAVEDVTRATVFADHQATRNQVIGEKARRSPPTGPLNRLLQGSPNRPATRKRPQAIANTMLMVSDAVSNDLRLERGACAEFRGL